MTERTSNIHDCYIKVNFGVKELMKEINLYWTICCGYFASLAKVNGLKRDNQTLLVGIESEQNWGVLLNLQIC